MWTQDMFGVEKPIIALLHLDALPGDPGYCGDMKTVTEHARKDLLALQDGGVDGILFANEFSLPYQPVADIAVVSAMAYIIGKLKDEISVPFGVNVVKNPDCNDRSRSCNRSKIRKKLFFRSIYGRIWSICLEQRRSDPAQKSARNRRYETSF